MLFNHEHVTYALQFFVIVFLHQDYISSKEYCLYTEQVCILNILNSNTSEEETIMEI